MRKKKTNGGTSRDKCKSKREIIEVVVSGETNRESGTFHVSEWPPGNPKCGRALLTWAKKYL